MKGDSAEGKAFRRKTPQVRPVSDVRASIRALGEDAKRVLAALPQSVALPTS